MLTLLAWAQPPAIQTVDLRLHIFCSEENEELGLTVGQAENLVAKIQADFNGSTANLHTGNPAANYDTRIDFCPEIIYYYDDDLIREHYSNLDAAYGSANKLDVYINYYGRHLPTGMIKGIAFGSSACWVGLIHAKMLSPTEDKWTATHEIGHVLGLGHSCASCYTEFMVGSTSGSSIIPYHFTSMQGTSMYNNLATAPYLLPGGCTIDYVNADFTVDMEGPQTGQPINFTNMSSSNVTTYTWNFGVGATPGTSTAMNPIPVQYSSGGYKEVTLTVSNGTDADIRKISQLIHVEPNPLSIPYYEDFDDPDILVTDEWFVEDDLRDGMTFLQRTETYMWHQSSAVGDYYINCSETIPFTGSDGTVGTGAVTLEVMNNQPDFYNRDIFLNSPDFNFTGVTCGTVSFDLCHIPFNNGYTLMTPPTGDDCECPVDYLSEPEYAGNTFPAPSGHWSDACTGITNPKCPGMALGYPDCSILENLSLEYSIAGAAWVQIYSQSRDELLTVPGESCTMSMFAPIDADWWRCENVAIPAALYNQNNVRFRFVYHSGEGTNTLLIDNFAIYPGPKVVGDIQNICGTTPGTATADVFGCTGIAPFTYQWYTDCGFSTTLPGETNQVFSTNTPGTYGVIVTDANGCTGQGCFTIPYNPSPCTPVTAFTICEGECVTIGCPSLPGHTYTWTHDESRSLTVNGNFSSYTVTVSDGNTSQICVSPLTTTTYDLVVDDGNGCLFNYSITVTVDHTPGCIPATGPSCCDENPPLYTFPCLTFEHTFGTVGMEAVGKSTPLHSGSVVQTGDRGYLMAGYTDEVGVGAWADQSVVKVDEEGTLQWTKLYGDYNGFSDMMDVIQTSDGNYVFCGALGLAGQTFAMHVMKTHPNGNIIWDRVLHGDDWANSRSVFEAANGDLILGGYSPYGGESFYAVRLSSTGGLIWRKNFRSTSNSYFSKVIEIQGGPNAGDLVFVGSTLANGIDGYILVTDGSGVYQWSGNYDMGGAEEFFDVIQDGNSDIWLAGYTTATGSGDLDAIVAKIPVTGGAPSWTMHVNGSGDEHFSSLCYGASNRIMVAGQSNSFNGPDEDFLVGNLKTNGGNPIGSGYWLKTFGDSADERGRDIIKVAPDGGYAIFGTKGNDYHLIRTDVNGNSYKPGPAICGSDQIMIVGNVSMAVNMTFQDLTTTHVDEITPAIPNFVMYNNQAISSVATWNEADFCDYDCGSLKTGGSAAENAMNSAAPSMVVFPNPTNGRITVRLPDETEGHVTLALTDMQGKILKTVRVESWTGEHDFSIRELPNGIYLLKVEGVAHQYKPKLVVKQ